MIHTTNKDVITRTEALCKAFGWQGGTIHQVAEFTGCDAYSLIYTEAQEHSQDHRNGWFAYRTNTLEYNTQYITNGVKGRLQFWIGVASGVQTCIKMSQPVVKKF